jgi:hypothetical protein
MIAGSIYTANYFEVLVAFFFGVITGMIAGSNYTADSFDGW